MDTGHVQSSKGRDFFGFRAPREALGVLAPPSPHGRILPRTVVLDLQRRDHDVRGQHADATPAHVIPFPRAHRAVVRILTDPECGGLGDSLEVLLPRRTFDQLADRQGASRITRLDLEAGIAADDAVLRHLGACLEHALETPGPAMVPAVDQIAASVTAHIAERYGGLQATRSPPHGGLAPWQLRLALAAFGRNLDRPVPLDDVASQCGLSASRFSRAFHRTMGLAPHRWLMQRRVDAAKDLMLAEPMPLAQVALACGFADQSHFIRIFAGLIGLTPARWRASQAREFVHG